MEVLFTCFQKKMHRKSWKVQGLVYSFLWDSFKLIKDQNLKACPLTNQMQRFNIRSSGIFYKHFCTKLDMVLWCFPALLFLSASQNCLLFRFCFAHNYWHIVINIIQWWRWHLLCDLKRNSLAFGTKPESSLIKYFFNSDPV